MRTKRKQKKKPSHAFCQRRHTKKRLIQRFDMQITTSEYKKIVKDIQLNKYPKARRLTNKRTKFYNVIIREQVMDVIYDKRNKTIVTVLYKNE